MTIYSYENVYRDIGEMSIGSTLLTTHSIFITDLINSGSTFGRLPLLFLNVYYVNSSHPLRIQAVQK